MIKIFYRLTFSYFVFLSVRVLCFASCAVTVWKSSGIPPVQISTNHQARDLISAFELNTAQYSKLRKEFDYLDDQDFESALFFEYKGQIYCLADFVRLDSYIPGNWQGIMNETYFSGILVKIVESCQSVIVASYCS